ncbi:MAG: ferritin-like domain-containing protein [Gammaproteobacteria bacterium]|nr:ferritin-like domain-containing protein [Gammaproteobacteria bacterium]
MANQVAEKVALTRQTAQAWRNGTYSLLSSEEALPIGEAGHPEKPALVSPADVPRRGPGSDEGRAALIHAITHIEFNAINLAWDAVYRFRGLPEQYYDDWIRVADEEAYHFELLSERLQRLGYQYGDFPAHNGLWAMAQKTADDPMVRMALVPRVLEARGLDVTPGMMARLKKAGDNETVAILEIILRDEIGHVKIGSRWFKYFCDERSLNPENTFRKLIDDYFIGELRGPFDYELRQQAGFSIEELKALEALASGLTR